MTFVDSVKSAYRNYFNFSGRVSQSGFWWYVLFYVLVWVVLTVVFGEKEVTTGPGSYAFNAEGGFVSNMWLLLNLIPMFSVACRRLHDIDRSGFWQLVGLVPLIGTIILIVFWSTRGTDGTNRFGPPPQG